MTHSIISHHSNHSEWAWGGFDIIIAWIETYATNLATHTADTYTHIARVLGHHHAVVFIQIEHRFFFERKVRNIHSREKGGSFRMVTFSDGYGEADENEEKKEACPS